MLCPVELRAHRKASCLRGDSRRREEAGHYSKARPHARPSRGRTKRGFAPQSSVLGHSSTGEIALVRMDSIRSEQHTSELQSLMRISYAVFCLKNKTHFH